MVFHVRWISQHSSPNMENHYNRNIPSGIISMHIYAGKFVFDPLYRFLGRFAILKYTCDIWPLIGIKRMASHSIV